MVMVVVVVGCLRCQAILSISTFGVAGSCVAFPPNLLDLLLFSIQSPHFLLVSKLAKPESVLEDSLNG